MSEMGQIIQFPRAPAAKRGRPKKTLSLYDCYKMPFFDRSRHCTRAVKPTGNYTEDCYTGSA